MFNKIVPYIGEMIEFAHGGFQEVNKETYEYRLAICNRCDFYLDNHCQLCGCRCQGGSGFTSKLRLPATECPDNPPRWGKHEITNKDGDLPT